MCWINEYQFMSLHTKMKNRNRSDKTSYKNMFSSSYKLKCYSLNFSCLIWNKYIFLYVASLLVSSNQFHSYQYKWIPPQTLPSPSINTKPKGKLNEKKNKSSFSLFISIVGSKIQTANIILEDTNYCFHVRYVLNPYLIMVKASLWHMQSFYNKVIKIPWPANLGFIT